MPQHRFWYHIAVLKGKGSQDRWERGPGRARSKGPSCWDMKGSQKDSCPIFLRTEEETLEMCPLLS